MKKIKELLADIRLWGLMGIIFPILLVSDSSHIKTSFWYGEYILFILFILGSFGIFQKFASTKLYNYNKAIPYLLSVFILSMLYEVSLTRDGSGVGGNHQDTFANIIISIGFYLPLGMVTYLIIKKYTTSISSIFFLGVGFSLAEAMIFRPVLLETIFSPLFFMSPFVLSYYALVYGSIISIPLFFIGKNIFISHKKILSTPKSIIYGFIIAIVINVLWGVVWGPVIIKVFNFPSVGKEILIPLQEETGDKERYNNTDYHFSLNMPTGSRITDSRKEQLGEYIRIQNYQSNDDSNFGLSTGEYYLEIWIELKETASQKSCKEIITESEELQLGTQVGYYGFGQEGGDAGGIRRYVCVEDEKFIYNFNATENSADTPIANAILESITFTQ